MAKAKVLDWGKCDWTRPKPGYERKCFQGSENVTITMGLVPAGRTPAPHMHDYEQTTIILKGKCDFRVGPDELYTLSGNLESGSIGFITVPANVMHWMDNRYGETCIGMDIFFPKRTQDRPESVPMEEEK